MSLKIKIEKGTARNDQSLCHTCRHSLIKQGQAVSDIEVYCTLLGGDFGPPPRLKEPVVECNRYSRIGDLDLGQMYDMAYYLVFSKGGKPGFLTAEQAKKRNLNDYD